ncbi:Uncharacterised protein [Actinomyces bovis]|uniref:Uncharacterized protein n=1 Tax=Actinomyces bovis TaxID=1658 RepID=A0ABY1VM72_9ACTO|nr:hypothetical protein [Actinomyces bovis]SPT53105.1 Uncharacterised protein [Actinomyces bovis]VEG56602.1 Uncharacterised protein [Actinomyces israelii]
MSNAQFPTNPGPGAWQGQQYYAPGPAPVGAPFNPQAPNGPQAKRGRGPAVLMSIGALLLVGAIISLVMLVVFASNTTKLTPLNNGVATASLDSSKSYGLYNMQGRARCLVQGPQGEQLELAPPTSSFTVNNKVLLATFTPKNSGQHQISCDADDFVYYGDAHGAGAVFGMVGLMGMMILGGIVGLPLLIAGIVWRVARR